MHLVFPLLLGFSNFVTYVNASRPWYLDEVSSELLKTAVELRNRNVPEAEASSVAKQIIDGALSPPQVTPLAQSLADMIIGEGAHLNPVKALELAVEANKAYGEVRTSVGFNNFLHFVSFQASKFNTKSLESMGQQPTRHGSTLQKLIENALTKLSQDAQGRQAITGVRQLANTIAHDAGVHLHF